jgi:hypothetical protein
MEGKGASKWRIESFNLVLDASRASVFFEKLQACLGVWLKTLNLLWLAVVHFRG